MCAGIVVSAGRYILKTDLVRGTWGNVSCRDGDKVWITPSGVPYDKLREDMVAVIDLESGEWIGGTEKPSSELPLHLEIYRTLRDIKAVVHFHGIYSSVFSVLREDVPCYIEDQAQIIGGTIRVARYAPPGTWELARNVVQALENRFGAILANHGAVSIGRSMEEALIAAEILEKSCHIAVMVNGKGFALPEKDVNDLREKYLDSYSKKLITPTEEG